jgi:uncharacterized protein (DUF1499 family)
MEARNNMVKRPRGRWLWLAGGAASVLLWMNRRLFTVNDVTAGSTRAYPDLKPHAYAYPPGQVFALAEAAAREFPRWRIHSVDRLGRELQVEAEVPLFGFVDDVTVRVDPIPGSQVSEVVVRSRSRRGAGDLGENARRIRAYYHSLDTRVRNAASPTDSSGPVTVYTSDDGIVHVSPDPEAEADSES